MRLFTGSTTSPCSVTWAYAPRRPGSSRRSIRDRAVAELEKVAHAPDAARRNRVSVLPANTSFPQTRTVTHVIWSMFGVLPPHSVQLPHHHEAVAQDLIIDAPRGCYSMIGDSVDEAGHIVNGRRAEWVTGSAFVTPPGL